MLCSRFLRVATLHSTKGFAGLMERLFDAAACEATKSSLGSCCATASVMLGVFVAVLVATVEMFGIVPKGFIPEQDNDQLNCQLRAAQGTSFYEMVDLGRAGRRHRHQESERRATSSLNTGGGGSASITAGSVS